MSRIQLASRGIKEVVVDEHLIPGSDEVGIDVESDLQVTIHSEETCQRAIDGIMERDAVQGVQRRITEEILVLTRCQISSSQETRGKLIGCSSTTARMDVSFKPRMGNRINVLVEGTESVTTSDLSGDEEVLLAQIRSALSCGGSPVREGVDCHLGSLIDTDGINIQGGDGYACESFELRHDGRVPFPETVLH